MKDRRTLLENFNNLGSWDCAAFLKTEGVCIAASSTNHSFLLQIQYSTYPSCTSSRAELCRWYQKAGPAHKRHQHRAKAPFQHWHHSPPLFSRKSAWSISVSQPSLVVSEFVLLD